MNPYDEPENPGLPPSDMELDLSHTALVITDAHDRRYCHHIATTTSDVGLEQQIKIDPSSGGSRGS